jgi:hypothetical protein
MAERRPLSFWAKCGRTFIDFSSLTKSSASLGLGAQADGPWSVGKRLDHQQGGDALGMAIGGG